MNFLIPKVHQKMKRDILIQPVLCCGGGTAPHTYIYTILISVEGGGRGGSGGWGKKDNGMESYV